MKSLLTYCMFFSFALFAQEEIEVRLSTEKPFVPIYLSRFKNQQTSFDQTYLDKLRNVLDFDLRHLAKTLMLHVDPKIEEQLTSSKEIEEPFWKEHNIAHLFMPRVKSKRLEVMVFSDGKALPQLFDTFLSGDLSQDRHHVHLLSSAIAKKLFDVEGIFTHRLIYTVRTEANSREGKKEFSEVWVCDYDGNNPKQITSRDDGYAVHPLFLPGKVGALNRSFLFVSYKIGVPKIYRSSFNNPKQLDRMVTLRGNQLIPAYSSERGLIAFISDAAGRPDLFIQEFDPILGEREKPQQLFSLPRATQASPAFSPDGEKLTFVSDKDGTPRIYLMKIPEDLSSQKRPFVHLVTKKNRQNVTPAWSVDGTKLAYSAKTDGVRQIWIYDFVTDEEWQLTKGFGNKENPTWAPDSVHIVYNTEDKDSAELYMVNIHHKKEEKINLGHGKKRFPSWETGSN